MRKGVNVQRCKSIFCYTFKKSILKVFFAILLRKVYIYINDEQIFG